MLAGESADVVIILDDLAKAGARSVQGSGQAA